VTDESKPNPSAGMVNREVLIHNLRLSFRSPAKAGRDSIGLLQARYVRALYDVAGFLTSIGAGDDIARKFIELADAIGQLRNGTVADIVRPATVGGRGPDGLIVWSLRAEVAIGLECLVRSRKMKKGKAAEYIAENWPEFDRLKRNTGASLKGSILSWRRNIDQRNAPEANDLLAHERKFFEQHGAAEMFALGEQVLANAAAETSRATF
jgi:hypothetical protein